MAMEVDWDLHAVVRAFTTTSSSSTSSSSSAATMALSPSFGGCYQPAASPACGFSIFGNEKVNGILSVSEAFEERNSIEGLNDVWRPFFSKSGPPSLQASPLSCSSSSSFPYFSELRSVQAQQKKHQQPNKQSHAGCVNNRRSKRGKNQQPKKVCQVPAEAVSSDIWAWRKYGQKPIKGSPYPRGYYRCSSSKGCLARKQVERSRSDPTMFIVTYTAEHNHPAPTHRNSLSGSTRQKPVSPQTATAGDSDKAPTELISVATPAAEEEVAAQSSKSENKEETKDLMDDEEDGFGLSDAVLTDDFFEGLDELMRPSVATARDCFSDPVSATLALPAWVANNAAATAGGS